MNYERIKVLSEKKSIALKDIAYKIGVTEAGFHKMLTNKTMKIETLEKISEILEVPVSYFFDEGTLSIVQTGSVSNCVNGVNHGTVHFSSIKEAEKEVEYLKKENEHLKNQLKDKDKLISYLEKK